MRGGGGGADKEAGVGEGGRGDVPWLASLSLVPAPARGGKVSSTVRTERKREGQGGTGREGERGRECVCWGRFRVPPALACASMGYLPSEKN